MVQPTRIQLLSGTTCSSLVAEEEEEEKTICRHVFMPRRRLVIVAESPSLFLQVRYIGLGQQGCVTVSLSPTYIRTSNTVHNT
jgi:hypothetical protein